VAHPALRALAHRLAIDAQHIITAEGSVEGHLRAGKEAIQVHGNGTVGRQA
jgi:hypothetical protein